MAKLKELSDILTESLCLDPVEVQQAVKDLQDGGRLPKSGPVDEHHAADLLCGLLCSDPINLTGAAALPFVDLASEVNLVGLGNPYNYVGPNHEDYAVFRDEFSTLQETLSLLIINSEFNTMVFDISVTGRDTDLHAVIQFKDEAPGLLAGSWVHFGFLTLPERAEFNRTFSCRMRPSRGCGGAILPAINRVLRGEPAGVASRPFEVLQGGLN